MIEMLVTIAIAAILMSMAVPSMRNLIERNSVADSVDSFVSAISHARAEAIRRGLPVTLCRSTNAATSATPACSADPAWEAGWMAFVDLDGDGTFESIHGDSLLRVQGALNRSGAIRQGAYPSYVESVRKSRRAEARAQLLEAAQYMQRFYSQNDSFKRAVGTGTDMTLPSELKIVPQQGAQTYAIDFATNSLTPSSFNLQATPTGSMKGDRCGTLQLDNVGRRNIKDEKAGVAIEDCWR